MSKPLPIDSMRRASQIANRVLRYLRTSQGLVAVFVVFAAIPRVWLAATDHSVFWPDEIYQSVEPAHRLVFGYGLIPWEFRDGARSWAFPGLVAAVLKVLSLFLTSSFSLIVGVKLFVVVVALAGVALTILLAERLAGRPAALLAGFLVALYPPLLVFSHRVTQEMASAPLVVLTVLLLVGSARHAGAAGAVLGGAFVLRFQNGLLAVVFVAELLLRRRYRDAGRFAGAAAAVAVAGGLLDWLTWGAPFHSLFVYVKFNLVQGGASTFGVEPFYYYAETLWTSGGPAIFVVIIGLLAAASAAPSAVAAVVVFVGVHSIIPHKEFRFVTPIMPLMLAVSAVGLVRLAKRLSAPGWMPSALGIACATAFATKAEGLTNGEVGHYLDQPYARASVWGFEEEPSLLLAAASRRPDVCGVLVLKARAAFTGGYSYLHRDVPLFFRHEACQLTPSANYAILPRDSEAPTGYIRIERLGRYSLYRRHGGCGAPPEEYDHMLEGADDMGIGRAPLRQPDKSELRLQAGIGAGAFVKGWGHGEHVDCRLARWATARVATVSFPLEPTGNSYVLGLSAKAFPASMPQRLEVKLNQKKVSVFDLTRDWAGYQTVVPAANVRSGQNTLELYFSNATPAGGGDERRLAALFERIDLVPKSAAITIDIGTSQGRGFLAGGFSHDERSGSRTAVWSDAPQSRIRLPVDRDEAPYVLRVGAIGYHPVAPVSVAVLLNETAIGRIRVPARWSDVGLVLPPAAFTAGTQDLRFQYERTARPRDVEPPSTDERALGIMFDTVSIVPLPLLEVIDFGTPDARPTMLHGFGADEGGGGRTYVWSDGTSSMLAIRLPDLHSTYQLRLIASAFAPASPQEVLVMWNGDDIGTIQPEGDWTTHVIPVPKGSAVPTANTLEFKYQRTALPKDSIPGSTDSRALAVRLDSLAIESVEPTDAR